MKNKTTVNYQSNVLYLTAQQEEVIRKLSYTRDVSRSAVVRDIIDEWLKLKGSQVYEKK